MMYERMPDPTPEEIVRETEEFRRRHLDKKRREGGHHRRDVYVPKVYKIRLGGKNPGTI